MKMTAPIPVVDALIEKEVKIILIKRNTEPFKGLWAIPGGHLELGETVEDGTIREAFEETGLKIKLKQILGVYSDPKRHPGKHTVATVFVGEIVEGELNAGSDAADAKWVSIDKIDFNNLAFDHGKILQDYLKWKKSKGTFWSSR